MDAGVELSSTTTANNGNGIRRYSDGIYPVAAAPSSSSSPPLLPSAASSSGTQRRLSCSWIFCTTLKLCNTVAVAVLAVLVVYIFLQLQYVNYQIAAQSQRLDDLVNQVTTQQSSQIAQLNQKVDSNHSLTLYQMAGTFGLLTWLITIFHMTSHIRNWHAPIVQRKIVTILWMPPIYGTTAFLSLVFPMASGYLAVISDFYEAYVIYTFLAFLIAVLGRGNRQVVVNVLAQHGSHLASPTRCLSSCYHPPPASSPQAKANAVLLECQVLCMQFVFLRPLTSIARFVVTSLEENHAHEQQLLQQQVQADNGSSMSGYSPDGSNGTRSMMTNYTDYDTDTTTDIADDAITSTTNSTGGGDGYVSGGDASGDHDDTQWAYFKSPNFYIAMITNVSVFFAFSGLLKFYHAVSQELQWLNPFQKFLAIKGIVFLTFWQGVCIAIFVQLHHQKQQTTMTSSSSSSIEDQAMEIQNVLLCLEMLFFSLAHFCVFPSEEWDPQYHERRLQELEEHDLDHDVIDDDDKNTHILASDRSRLPQHRRRPRRQLHRGGSPSIGLGDFASDVGYILSSRRRKRRQQQQQLSQHDDDDVDANDCDNDNTVSTLKTKSSEEYTENDEEENNDTVRIEEEEEDVLDFSIDDNEVTRAAGTTSVTAASHQDSSHMEII